MSKRHRNLIHQISDINNLRNAYCRASQGKRKTWGYLEFKEYAEANLLLIQEELLDGSYRIGSYREFIIYEPKERLISALDFKDRLVQHALCNIIGPIFEAGLLPYTFACRPNKGTHAGVKHIQSLLRRTNATYFLKTDFTKYFSNINREVLHQMIDKKIHCARTLQLIREIIPIVGKGIPIGSLTSQLFANVYGNVVDRYLHFTLGQRYWARYMDDIVILGYDQKILQDVFNKICIYVDINLHLLISKWQISSISRGINFLGYRIWPYHKLLRKDSVIRAKRKIENYLRIDDRKGLQKFLVSWYGHACWADTYNLIQDLELKYAFTYYQYKN